MSTKFPVYVLHMEMSEQLDLRKSWLGAKWAPRDQNVHADALTNEDFHEFDMQKRMSMDPGAIDWMVLDTLIEFGGGMVEELKALKEKRKRERRKTLRKRRSGVRRQRQ